MNKNSIKKITSMRLFLPIVCLVAVLLVNLITTPGFFKVSINNGVLYGYIVDVVNRASELVILAVGMTLVTAASGGQDISVGAVMAVAAAVCCQILSGGEVSVTELAAPMGLAIIAAILASALCGAFNGFLVAKMNIQPDRQCLPPHKYFFPVCPYCRKIRSAQAHCHSRHRDNKDYTDFHSPDTASILISASSESERTSCLRSPGQHTPV